MSSALILIDFQNEWIDQKSDYFVGDISDVLLKTNTLIDYCRKHNYKIIFTRHVELDSTDAFADGSHNADIIATLHKEPTDIVITKNKISPFFETPLDQELENVEQVVVCGLLTNLCVRSCVEGAYDRDKEITLVKDCSTTFDAATHDFTLKDLKATREEIEMTTLQEFLDNQ